MPHQSDRVYKENNQTQDVSSDPVIAVKNLSKVYTIWSSPAARLHGPLLGQIGQWPFLPAAASTFCRQLSHESFRNFYALRDVSFEVHRGESVGIIGLNGSGKSTLLQILADTLQPTDGSVTVNGRVAALLELGSGFNPEFTGRENVHLYAAILGWKPCEVEDRFQRVAEFAEIGQFMDQPVKTYSSGMQVRLAYSVATAALPDILIVDEALSVGDVYFQHKCFAQIRRFQEQGTTLLFVSHDPGAVKTLCDRAVLLDAGVVIRDGLPDVVLDYYNAIIARHAADQEVRQGETADGRRTTRSGNGRASFETVELLQQDRSVRALRVNEAATLRVRAVAHESLTELSVGFVIRDRLGNDVFGTNTHHLQQPLAPVPGRPFTVDFHLPNVGLGAGHYSVTVALHSGTAHIENNYDWWDQALVFQIIPGNHSQFSGVCWLHVAVQSDAAVELAGKKTADSE